MYSSGYSQVNKFSPEARKKMQQRSKGKSCGYYMRIIFFFSSLIQSLIIVSLVLFLIYGKTQDSASATRIQDLEESFSRLSIENVALRQQRQNLTNKLNVTVTEKARNDWDLNRLRYLSNISIGLMQDFERKIQQCNMEVLTCGSRSNPQTRMFSQFPANRNCDCGQLERENARLELVRSNFTQTTKLMRMEMDQLVKERDKFGLDAIHLRRNKSILEMELESYRARAKDEFHHSLSSVTNVSRAFLQKIESLFPRHLAFQLTCPKQREHLEQIHSNCTSLSREVEDRLQGYLNSVGDQVSHIQAENTHLKAENTLLSQDYGRCSQNHERVVKQNKQERDELQRKHDNDKEKLLVDKVKLNGDIEVLELNVKHKSKEIDHLTEQVRQLNMSCMAKTGQIGNPFSRTTIPNQPGWNLPGGGRSGSFPTGNSNFNQFGKPVSGGLGPNFGIGSVFNKPASTGTGSSGSSYSSSGSSSSLGNTGGGYNKPASTGTGSSSSSYSPSGSSSSLGNTGGGYNKPASTGTGSSSSSYSPSGSSSSLGNTGYGYNKPASTGTGSSGSSYSSSGSSSSLGNTGGGYNKPASTGTGSSSSSYSPSGSSSSLGNTGGGYNKPASTGTGSSSSSYSSSGSSSSQSKAGLGINKPGSSGGSFSSYGSTGSSSGHSSAGTASSKSGVLGRDSSGIGSTGLNTNLGSTGIGSKQSTTNGKTSGLGYGSSSSSTSSGSSSRSGSSSSGLNWLGLGSSSLGQSNTQPQKTPSGSSYGGSGLSLGGRTSGLGGGSGSASQHIRELQRMVNPSSQQERPELSRMLG